MNKLLRLQITNAVNIANRKFTLLQIVELLEQFKISPVGNLTNTSKKKLLMNSLKSAKKSSVEQLVAEVNSNHSGKDNPSKLNQDLHASFKKSKVERFLNVGEPEEAIRIAFLRINNRVKKMSGLTIDGASLMRSAFSVKAPKIKVNSFKTKEELDEQEGLMHIFEGSMLAFRNPPSHDDEKKITPQDTDRILSLSNYLMSILDRVETGK